MSDYNDEAAELNKELQPLKLNATQDIFEENFEDIKDKSEEKEENNSLQINILEDNGYYQEVEIICAGKKRRRRITKLLPSNLANMVLTAKSAPCPSMGVGATNSSNLSQGLENGRAILLQEKFLRVISNIHHFADQSMTSIWDSENRINTTQKAVLLAVMNSTKESNQTLDRTIISKRSSELENKEQLQDFLNEVIDLTRNPAKLSRVLFGDLIDKIGSQKQTNLLHCLQNLVEENDDSKRHNQVKFLERITSEVFQTSREL